MKRLIYIVGMIVLLSSCNKKEIENLTIENQRLEERIEELEYQVQVQLEEIQEKTEQIELIEEIESQLRTCSQELMVCQYSYEGYRYGNLFSTTRYVEGRGQVTIHGAENVINFLNDHYRP